MHYLGLFAVSFLAGSFFPLGSEVYFLALKEQGESIFPVVITATVGNSLGGMTTYWIGRYGGEVLIQKYLKVKAERILYWQEKLHGRGAWIAFFCWAPFVGEVIGAVLGLLKVNQVLVAIFMTFGKMVRYIALWNLWFWS